MEVGLDTEGRGVEEGGRCPGSRIAPQQAPPPLRAGRASSVSPAPRTQQGCHQCQVGTVLGVVPGGMALAS